MNLENYYRMFTDLWRFTKKYMAEYDETNAYAAASDLVKDADRLSVRYHSGMLDQMILAAVSEIERVKEGKRVKEHE